MILSLTINDPRLVFPIKYKAIQAIDSSASSRLMDWNWATPQSDIWNAETRSNLVNSMIPEKDLNTRRSLVG